MEHEGRTHQPLQKLTPEERARKDTLLATLAIKTKGIFDILGLPLQQIREDIGPENRVIRNAGMLAMPLYTKIFETEETLRKQKEEKTYYSDQIEKIEKRLENENKYDINAPVHENDLRCKMKKLKKEILDLELYDRIASGSANQWEMYTFLEFLRSAIPLTLGIRPQIFREIKPGDKLSIEGLICLSVLNPDLKLKIRERAEQYIRDNDPVATVLYNHFSEYFFHSHNGIREQILREDYGMEPPLSSSK